MTGPSEPMVAPVHQPAAQGTPPRDAASRPVVGDIPYVEGIPDEGPREIFQPVPDAPTFDENPPEPHEFLRPADPSPPSPPDDAEIDPSFRRLPTFQEICPPMQCSRKKAIDVFNGVLSASLKRLVHAVQDGLCFGGEIALYCRGVDSQHGPKCFCRSRNDEMNFIFRQFIACLESNDPAPKV